ncbi:hypothetical protein DB30_00662 [Enhygromyxa salina]|uniref:Uncharacterized protein n=2 Tax=Enhygromyxa salina TaxID=215803 RepID=A0A0C2DFI5_9BACT|nr:hypothetical protein DB30_00662 [Enhygromyxa salina]
MASEEHPAELFIRFVKTFTPDSHPQILAMSGGEALLRPTLVRQLAERAREAGTRSSVLSGLFFASSARIPPSILAAIRAVDHFSVSLDVFHERQVARADVFRVLDALLGEGVDLSLHIVGRSPDDPYLEDVIGDVRRTYADTIPMLVNLTAAFGRARAWLTRKLPDRPAVIDANPCAMAAWPVVGFDGTIVACGNDDALDQRPAHLRLGHASVDDWATIRARSLESAMLRAIRLYGPKYVAATLGSGLGSGPGSGPGCSGYCDTCMSLPEDPVVAPRVAERMAKPSTSIVEAEAAKLIHRAGALGFAGRQGLGGYAHLIALGSKP